MEFATLSYFLFFLAVFASFWSVPARFRWIVLLLASGFFLSWLYMGLPFIVILLIGIGYIGGRLLDNQTKFRRGIFGISLLVILGCLVSFKYLNFFIEVFHVPFSNPLAEWALPVGISFYTFQLVGYLIDVYLRKTSAERHFGAFALSILFFPKFLSGPIEKPQHLVAQFFSSKKLEYGTFLSGLRLFVLGLFKKLVVADNIVWIANRVFGSMTEFKGLSLVLGVFVYAWYIYADFSGYTDMARGSARMLGIQLSPNFHFPYLATSIRDFWRRWHISLSTWLKDYVYIPLGGSRVNRARLVLNTMIVFIICGIWHGAAWTFLFWGIWHGFWVTLEHMVAYMPLPKLKLPKIFGLVYSWIIVAIGWIFFRVSKLEDVWYIIRNIPSGLRHVVDPTYVLASVDQIAKANTVELVIAAFGLFAIMIYEFLWSRQRVRTLFHRVPAIFRFFIYLCIVVSILLLRNSHTQTFVYVQF